MKTLLLVPLAVAAWAATPLPKKQLPELHAVNGALRISTQKGAGGFAYLLPEPILFSTPGLRVTWKWRIERFPRALPHPPFDKGSDDYAIRVGLLLSDGHTAIRGIELKGAPPISRVLLYGATLGVPEGTRACGPSPYEKLVLNCALGAARGRSIQETVTPTEDLQDVPRDLKIVGFWLFADGDNSASETDAELQELKILQER